MDIAIFFLVTKTNIIFTTTLFAFRKYRQACDYLSYFVASPCNDIGASPADVVCDWCFNHGRRSDMYIFLAGMAILAILWWNLKLARHEKLSLIIHSLLTLLAVWLWASISSASVNGRNYIAAQ